MSQLTSLRAAWLKTASLGGASLAALLALTACAALPAAGPSAQPRSPAALASSETLAAAKADWPVSDWWTAYGDAQLDQLIEQALAGAPDMAAAKARLDQAQSQRAQTRSGLYPSLEARASPGVSKQSYNDGFPVAFVPKGYNDIGAASLNLSYDLDFWGKTRGALAAATSDVRASAADLAAARLTLSTAVAAAYADLSRLYDERDVAEGSVKSRLETLDLANRRLANGLDTRADLKEAEAGVPEARADLAAIDEQIAQTRNQIAALIGQGPDRGLAITRPAKARIKAFGLPERLGASLIGRRPDVVAARWRVEAAASRINVAKAQFYPDINLTAFVGFQSLYLKELFASGSDYGQVAPALTLPIFEGGRLRAGLKGARAEYAAAVASYDSALIEALREVADTTASERALSERLAESREALAAEEEAYRLARARYDGGLSNYQSVLIVEDRVLQSRRTVVDLEARAFALDIQLIKALGGGFGQA